MTECTAPFILLSIGRWKVLGRRQVTTALSATPLTSGAGAAILGRIDGKAGVTARLAAVLDDSRGRRS